MVSQETASIGVLRESRDYTELMYREDEPDRISRLPDELLCHVLSFLATKEAVLTAVLSKRWRNLFALVRNLNLDDSVFMHPEEGERYGAPQSFINFVERVLALKGDSLIEKFSLKCIDSDHVNPWICRVLERGVLDVDLLLVDFGVRYPLLPFGIFMSRTLVKLKIATLSSTCFWCGDIYLPMLKTLALDSVSFGRGQLRMLLSACPVLEELHMTNICVSRENEIVSSATLKTLTLATISNNLIRDFSFDTPKLVCLNYSGCVADDYPLVNLENLVEARIKLMVYLDLIEKLRVDSLEDDVYHRLGNVRKLVRGICNVEKLYLSPSVFQVLALCCQAMPVFNNLTFLEIESSLGIAWQAMPVLLMNCPQLDTLVIKRLLHRVTDKCGDACNCIPREEKGRSLMSCPVKRLEIRGFDGTTIELEMIKHFLDYLPCLKEMEIYIAERQRLPELNYEMLMRYNELSGRSGNVEFKVHGSAK